MPQPHRPEEESKLEKEKAARFSGTARVRLKWLHFRNNQLDEKHVQDLQLHFQRVCDRIDTRNHITAIIDQQHLDSAIQISGISEGILPKDSRNEFPELGFWTGYELECLHGKHRIQAAKQALLPHDMWWVVDLYPSDISTELKRALTEEYTNERRPSDGEIYRKIREYQFQDLSSLEERWWTRLSSHRATNLKQLFRHPEIVAAFDSFLEIPALLEEGMRISTLHKAFAIRCDEENLRYLCHIKDFWFNLLQQDQMAMKRVDQTTVKVLELTAPWASTSDAQKLRAKVLGGDIFRAFNQQEREDIWNRLQSFKGLVPSLYGFFEDIKLLEAWADCLKWIVHLGARDTVSTALRKIYTGANQEKGSALVQEKETTFRVLPADLAYQVDLGCRQLWAFAMRYHREIPRKPSGKNLLARPTAMVNTSMLREMADLANQLGFGSSEITALRQYPKSADSAMATGNSRPILVTVGPGETKKERCGMPHIRSYHDDRQFLFVSHLHDDRNEQSEGITSFFRLRSVYSNFYGIPGYALQMDQANPEEHLASPTEEGTSQPYPARQSKTMDIKHMDLDMGENEPEQEEDTAMHDGPLEEQRPPLQVQEVRAQEKIMQEQQRGEILSNAFLLEKQEHEQEMRRQNLLSNARILEKNEQEQEEHRRKLEQDARAIIGQRQQIEQRQQQHEQQQHEQQQQGQQQQKLLSNVNTSEADSGTPREHVQEHHNDQQRQKLLSGAHTTEEQVQDQERYRQELVDDAILLEAKEQEHERRRQRLESEASKLKGREQEQEQTYQDLTAAANTFRQQGRRQEEQRQILAKEEGQLMSRQQKQEEKQQKLVEWASDLKIQEMRHNEQRRQLTADVNELNKERKRYEKLKNKVKEKRESKKVELKELGSRQDRSDPIQEGSERDIGELQRRGQEELADLESPNTLELKHRGGYADQSTRDVRAEDYTIYAPQESGIHVGVSASSEERNDPAQECGPPQNEAQRMGSGDEQKEEIREKTSYEAEAPQGGWEPGVQERAQHHRLQKDGRIDTAHGETAHNDEGASGGKADEAQEAVQEDEAHKYGLDGGGSEDSLGQYRARKRRVIIEESDDGEALRAQQVREGRKPVEKGKFQRLNRCASSNQDVNPEDNTSIEATKEGSKTHLHTKEPQTPRHQPRHDLPAQQRAANATVVLIRDKTNDLTDFASDFTYEVPQPPS